MVFNNSKTNKNEQNKSQNHFNLVYISLNWRISNECSGNLICYHCDLCYTCRGCDNVIGVKACLRHKDHVVIIMPYFPHDRFQVNTAPWILNVHWIHKEHNLPLKIAKNYTKNTCFKDNAEKLLFWGGGVPTNEFVDCFQLKVDEKGIILIGTG